MAQFLFWLKDKEEKHQNIFNCPEGIITDRSNGTVTIMTPRHSIKHIPETAINSEKAYKGNYYFDDFQKLITFAVTSSAVC